MVEKRISYESESDQCHQIWKNLMGRRGMPGKKYGYKDKSIHQITWYLYKLIKIVQVIFNLY